MSGRDQQVTLANVGLHVASIDRSLELYRDLLGLRVEHDSGWIDDPALLALTDTAGAAIRIVRLVSSGAATSLTLVEMRDIERTPARGDFEDPGTIHLALRVRGLDELHARICAAGYRPLAPPAIVTGGPPETSRIAFVVDRDGFVVELIEPV